MKKTFYIIIVTAFVMAIGACSITQDYYFNKDFSGSVKNTIEMGSLIGLMQMSDTTGSMEHFQDSLNLEMDKLVEKIKDQGGKNASYGWNEAGTQVFFKYEFPSLETLNKIVANTGSNEKLTGTESEKSTSAWFEKKGRKTLIYHPPTAELGAEGLGESAQYAEMYKYNINFAFARKIKSVNNDSITINSDKNGATLNGSLFDMYDKKHQQDIVFKLK